MWPCLQHGHMSYFLQDAAFLTIQELLNFIDFNGSLCVYEQNASLHEQRDRAGMEAYKLLVQRDGVK